MWLNGQAEAPSDGNVGCLADLVVQSGVKCPQYLTHLWRQASIEIGEVMTEDGVVDSQVSALLSRGMKVLALFAIVCVTLTACNDKQGSVSDPTQPTLHPSYSKFDFGDKDSLVRLGVQPMYVPTGLILETVRRDRFLADELRRHGKRLKLFPCFKGDDVNHFMRRGQLEGGVVGDMPAITAAATCDITIPVLLQQGFITLVARRYMLLEELCGHKIGYAYGSNAHYALLNALANGGLSESDVTLVPMEATEMPEALHSGAIDAYSAWEPIPALCLLLHPHYTAVHRSLCTGFLYFTNEFIEENPEVVHAILASVIRAVHWLQDDRQNMLLASEWTLESIRAMTGKELGLSAAQLADLASKDILGNVYQPTVPKSILAEDGALRREFEFLKDLGKISTEIEWSRIQSSFNHELLEEVQSDAVKNRLNELSLISLGDDND